MGTTTTDSMRVESVLGTFARQMSIPTIGRFRSAAPLRWWEWGKLAGIATLVAWATLSLADVDLHPAVVGVLLHVTLDFTLQASETCKQKLNRGRHLLVHSLAAGGLPPAVAALTIGSPAKIVVWAVGGAIVHYAVDWTRKFGLRNQALGSALDQACHVLTILALAVLG